MSRSVTVNPFFTPTQISGCQLWLDAADQSSLSLSGASLSQIRDKSGNAYNATQATLASQPIWSSNRITFSNNKYLDFPQAAINNTTTYALFLVFNPIASVNWIIQKQYNGVGSYNMLSMTNFWQNNTGITNYLYWNAWPNTYSPINSGTALQLNTVQLVEVTYNGTTLNMFQNGNLLSSATGTYNIQNQLSATNCTIGSWRPDGGIQNSGVTNFQFGEFVYYNTSLTIQQRQQIEGYLAWKWGLQSSLPANHPYKNSPIPPLLNPPVTLTPATPNLQWVNWSPLQVSGCSLWLDAATSFLGFTNGQTISSWIDRSSNGFVGSAINSPRILTNSINGLPTVQFNGTNQYINFGNVINMGSSQIYVFSVVRFSGDGAIVQKSSFRGNAGRWFLARITGDGGMVMGIDATGGGVVAPFADTTATTQMVAGYWDRNTIYTFQNGTQRASSILINSTNLSNTDPLYVGAYGNSSGTGPQAGLFLNGVVGEILVYLTSMTVSQRQQIEGYLAWKWGLVALLPSTHPYKNAPPFTPRLALPLRSIAQTASFTPLSINGCSLWLDAIDRSSLTLSGTTVSQWNDKSGSGLNVTQATGSLQPTYNSASLNNLPSIRFTAVSGSSFQELTTATTNLFNSISNLTYFVVFNLLSASTPPNPSPFSIQNKVSFYLSGLNNAGGFPGTNVWTYNGSSFVANQNTSITYNQSQQTCLSLATGSQQFFTNGVLGGPQNTPFAFGSGTSLVLRIGYSGYNTNDGFNGFISEVLVYTQALTTSQRQQIEGYLAWKWGLQGSLPATHPFKKWPPSP